LKKKQKKEQKKKKHFLTWILHWAHKLGNERPRDVTSKYLWCRSLPLAIQDMAGSISSEL